MEHAAAQLVALDRVVDEAGGAELFRHLGNGQLIFQDSSGQLSFSGLRAIVDEWKEGKSGEPHRTHLEEYILDNRPVSIESNGLGGVQVRTGRGTPWPIRELNSVLEQFAESSKE